jgi:uncharacterized membrane protein
VSEKNFLVVDFPQASAAFEAFSALRPVAGIEAAAVVARDKEGHLSVPESTGGGGSGFWTGSLIGALVGVLGGPFGVLLGWSAGALIGTEYDWSRTMDETDNLSVLSERIQPGSNVLMVEATESDETELDAVLAGLQGHVFRIPAAEVAAEVEQADRQAKEAARLARKARREERQDAVHARVHGWFHGGSPTSG